MAYFITFEGGEGTGKSTQIQLLSDHLTRLGIAHIKTREPGGTPMAEKIRDLLVTGKVENLQAISEALLMSASRVEHIHHVILPALQRGEWVLCDRFIDSTVAYQGYGHQEPLEFIEALKKFTCGNLVPHRTFLLDVPVEVGLSRSTKRLKETSLSEDRYENMGTPFHERVRRGYLEMAAKEPERFCVIDAIQSVEKIQSCIQKNLQLLTKF